jgi:hypothetical protein
MSGKIKQRELRDGRNRPQISSCVAILSHHFFLVEGGGRRDVKPIRNCSAARTASA